MSLAESAPIAPEHLLLEILNEVDETGGSLATDILKDESAIDLARLAQRLEAAIVKNWI